MERKQWLAQRKTGIGGSDVAAILGFSPWRTAMDVWMDKKGLSEEKPDPDKQFLFDLGLALEPVIAGLYTKQTGRPTGPGEFTRHPDYPILVGTPDRICTNEPRGVELKTENEFMDSFGDPGSADVPPHYYLQCAHYMAVMDLPHWDVAVLHSGSRFGVYQLERDLELEESLIDQLRVWWDRHIVGNVPPDIDGSQGWRLYLHKKHPIEMLPVAEISPDLIHVVERLAKVREMERVIETMRDEAENELKEAIGDRAGFTSALGSVTWKKTKDTEKINWEKAFQELSVVGNIPFEICTNVMQGNVVHKPGVRRFLFTPRKVKHGNVINQSPEPARIADAADATD